MQNLANQAITDAQTSSDALSGNISSLISSIDTAKDAVSGLSSAITDWGNENIQQIDDIAARISWVISESEPSWMIPATLLKFWKMPPLCWHRLPKQRRKRGEQGESAAAELQQASKDLKDAATHVKNCESHIRSALEIAKPAVDDNTRSRVKTSGMN